ncbi:MAG: TetR/AcrR family transcriptional regulator [Pseudomonadota bacterium]
MNVSNTERYHHGDLRRALIDRALDVIAAGGTEAISVRALSRDIGVTHRAAAAHFSGKAGLVAAALAEGYDRLARRLEEAVAESGADEADAKGGRLLRIGVAYGAFARDETALFLAMNGARVNEGGEHQDLEDALQRAFSQAIAAARADGFADPEGAALHFWACLQGVLAQSALGRIRVNPEKWDDYFLLSAKRILFGLSIA